MIKIIRASDIENGSKFDFAVNLPKSCPHCGIASQPNILSAHYLERENSIIGKCTVRIFVIYFCTVCESAFHSVYKVQCSLLTDLTYPLDLTDTYPTFHKPVMHPQKIAALSPRYTDIYNQAFFSEESGLFEICGMGYRKALEILIKDFAIKMHPNDIENIKSKMLGKCIDEYIDNPKIKMLAKASAWIGNDLTHYAVRNGDYSIEEMKNFIAAAEAYINTELEVLDAAAMINA